MARPSETARPRWGRVVAMASSMTVTAVAVLAGLGVIATDASPSQAAEGAGLASAAVVAPAYPTRLPSEPTPPAEAPQTEAPGTEALVPTALPEDSGEGRRVVFSESGQRVWLVDGRERVRRTYLVSGSVEDNLRPGTYEVWSRSRWAVGIDDSGVMQWFVRFTRGPSGAAIGFHSIPTKNGTPLQGIGDLGTPQSHGCIRQRTADAVALWRFARMGATVVVTA